MLNVNTVHALLPEISLLAKSLIVLVWGLFQKKDQSHGSWLSFSCLLGLMVSIAILLLSPQDSDHALSHMFQINSFTLSIKVLLLTSTALLFLFTLTTREREFFYQFECPLLILFSVLGMMIMVSANDLLILFMGMELQSLPLYILVALRKDSVRSAEAGLKFFILGALATGLFLFGSSFLYGATGSTQFDQIARVLGNADMLLIGGPLGVAFVIGALAFKSSLCPFHMWTPDVYEGTPHTVTLFLATTSKVTILAVTMRLLYGPFFSISPYWQIIIGTLALFSMWIGALGGLIQSSIKRLLAYSTIGHMGYIFAAISAGATVELLFVYVPLYVIMVTGIFGILMILGNKDDCFKLENLQGLSTQRPAIAAVLAVLMFSLAGIPPLGGFFSKLWVLQILMHQEAVLLALMVMITSVVSCFYYLNIVRTMYFMPPMREERLEPGHTPILHRVLLLGVCGVTTLFFLILPLCIPYFPRSPF